MAEQKPCNYFQPLCVETTLVTSVQLFQKEEEKKIECVGLIGGFAKVQTKSCIQSATSFLFRKFTFSINTKEEPTKRSLKNMVLFHET